jgi:hypothetical protein
VHEIDSGESAAFAFTDRATRDAGEQILWHNI